jgi:hypothetical protein
VTDTKDPQAVIRVATKKGILREPTLGLIAVLKRHWAVAVSTEPLARDAANESLSAVRHILAITPVKEPITLPSPRPATLPEKALAHA